MQSLGLWLMVVIDRPFMRIDLYTTGEVVILAELTPGGAYHGIPYALSSALDAELGGLMICGYHHRHGWPVPAIAGTPPPRWADRIFAAAASQRASRSVRPRERSRGWRRSSGCPPWVTGEGENPCAGRLPLDPS